MTPRRLVDSVLVICLLAAGSASAQVLKNPTIVTFTPADYNLVERFQGGYFQIVTRPDGTCDAAVVPATPIQLEDLQKPDLQPNGEVHRVLASRPAFGCFVYEVRALAGVYVSPWSDPSNDFQLTPLQQGRPVIR